MKSSIQLVLAVLALTFSSGLAHAEHNEHNNPTYGGGAQYLVQQAYQLNSVVQYSYMAYHVKQAVNSFVAVSNRWASCQTYGGGYSPAVVQNDAFGVGSEKTDGFYGTLDHNEHNNPGYGGCDQLKNQVLGVWARVERFLYDTNYEFPGVYQQYLQTRQSVESIRYSY